MKTPALGLLLLWAAARGAAEEAPFVSTETRTVIASDRVRVLDRGESVEFTGRVALSRGGDRLTADRVVTTEKNTLAEAWDRVYLRREWPGDPGAGRPGATTGSTTHTSSGHLRGGAARPARALRNPAPTIRGRAASSWRPRTSFSERRIDRSRPGDSPRRRGRVVGGRRARASPPNGIVVGPHGLRWGPRRNGVHGRVRPGGAVRGFARRGRPAPRPANRRSGGPGVAGAPVGLPPGRAASVPVRRGGGGLSV
ncbi:MAG: hypothetical protein IPQ26_07475 [Elusimicrobia bacterium]|nr:hypothetical protein [Elusimicrobiota bacterium]